MRSFFPVSAAMILFFLGCAETTTVIERADIPVARLAFMSGARISIGGSISSFIPDNGSLTRKAVVAAASAGADATILLGDMISNSAPDNSEGDILAKSLGHSPVPVFAVPGKSESNPPVPGLGFAKEGFLNFMNAGGYEPPSYPAVFDLDNLFTVFIFDTASTGKLEKSNIDWLLAEAGKRKSAYKIVALYNPIAVPDNAPELAQFLASGAIEAEKAFKEAGITAVVSSAAGAPFMFERSGILHVGLGNISKFPNTYLFVEAEGDGPLVFEFRGLLTVEAAAEYKRLIETEHLVKKLGLEYPAGTRIEIGHKTDGEGASGGK